MFKNIFWAETPHIEDFGIYHSRNLSGVMCGVLGGVFDKHPTQVLDS